MISIQLYPYVHSPDRITCRLELHVCLRSSDLSTFVQSIASSTRIDQYIIPRDLVTQRYTASKSSARYPEHHLSESLIRNESYTLYDSQHRLLILSQVFKKLYTTSQERAVLRLCMRTRRAQSQLFCDYRINKQRFWKLALRASDTVEFSH